MGRSTLVLAADIYVQPDPNKITSVEVDFQNSNNFLLPAGGTFPGMIVLNNRTKQQMTPAY